MQIRMNIIQSYTESTGQRGTQRMKYSKDIVLRGVELVQLWSKVSTVLLHKIRTELRP